MTPAAKQASLLAAVLVATGSASAAEPYVATGFPYLLVGVSQPIDASFALRADFGSIAHHRYSGSTSDNDFRGSIQYNRGALLADWFVMQGGFRLSAGATFNDAKATVTASAHSGKITLGGVQYDAPSSLYFVQSDLSFPKAMPYVGLGWGHQQSAPGLSFNFDLRRLLGTAKATPLKASPALASELALNAQGASDLQQESRDFQDEVHKLKAIPQLTIGVGYRF